MKYMFNMILCLCSKGDGHVQVHHGRVVSAARVPRHQPPIYTLHTQHCTLHITHYTPHYTPHLTDYTLHTAHYTPHYTPYSAHYTLHTIQGDGRVQVCHGRVVSAALVGLQGNLTLEKAPPHRTTIGP